MADLHSKYLFIASMDVDPDREAVFNDVYNTEHCPLLNQVPGVQAVTRYETQRLIMAMGGEVREDRDTRNGPGITPCISWIALKS